MGRSTQNRTRYRRLLLPSCCSSWWGHTPGHRIGPSAGHSVGTSRAAKGANATRTTEEAAVEEAEMLRTARDPSATRTTVVVEISLGPTSTAIFKTAKEASATRTTHLGNSG